MKAAFVGRCVQRGARLKRSGFLILAIAVAFIVLAVVAVINYIHQENYLLNNPRWLPTKKLKNMMSGPAFLAEHQSLAGNALNLGAWNGFQTVLYRTPLTLQELSCRFRLNPDAHLCIIFDRQEDLSWALRFSSSSLFPNALLRPDVKGRFHSRTPIPVPAVTPDSWHAVRLVFAETGVRVLLDGQEYFVPVSLERRPGTFGFRNGMRNVTVDDVRAVDALTGEVYSESFSGAHLLGKGIRFVLFSAGAVAAGIYALWRLFAKHRRAVLEHTLATVLTLIAAGIVFAVFHFYVLAGRYPNLKPLVGNIDITSEAHRPHCPRSRFEQKPRDGKRVLFLGSSQVEGLGANEPSECFVAVLQDLLRDRCHGHPPLYCINAGVGACTIKQVMPIYEKDLADCPADLTVVTLACNDSMSGTREEDYAQLLEVLAREIIERGSKVLFVVEAACIESGPNGWRLDPAFRRVGERLGIPIVDASAALRAQYDTGFVFEDYVHPTSYGHRLIADVLSDPILQNLGLAKECPPSEPNAR